MAKAQPEYLWLATRVGQLTGLGDMAYPIFEPSHYTLEQILHNLQEQNFNVSLQPQPVRVRLTFGTVEGRGFLCTKMYTTSANTKPQQFECTLVDLGLQGCWVRMGGIVPTLH